MSYLAQLHRIFYSTFVIVVLAEKQKKLRGIYIAISNGQEMLYLLSCIQQTTNTPPKKKKNKGWGVGDKGLCQIHWCSLEDVL